MIRFRYIFIFSVMLMVLSAKAQQTTAQQTIEKQCNSLKIGDQLPDFNINKVLNPAKRTRTTNEKTASFKDRLLIIDFWATSCSGCVATLPKMEALQKQFGAKVKILPVTFEPAVLITSFWKKNKYTKALTLPTVVEDKQFRSHFPHAAIPHEIWVYKGKVIGITDASYVDAYNIEQVLSGKVPNWPIKDDYYYYDASKYPLFKPDEKQVDANSIYTYAAISDYKEKDGASAAGVFGNLGSVRDSVKKTIRTWFINQAIFTAYTTNWNSVISMGKLVKPSFALDPNQIVWEVSDPTKYTGINSFIPDDKVEYYGDWMRNNAICFESVKRDTGQRNKDISKGIIQDLNRLLGLNVRWEKRKENVLVLVNSVKKGSVSTKQVKTNVNAVNSVDRLVYELNQVAKNPYVFNEIKGNMELVLNVSSYADIQAVRKALLLHGLDLKEEERMVDKFVFSEVNGGLLVNVGMIDKARARMEAQKELGMPDAEMNRNFMEQNKKKPGVISLPSGLQYRVIKTGKGPMPAADSRVRVNYTGRLANGKIFESSFEAGKPGEFNVKDVIKGWTEALKLMPEGAEWELYIPAELAYGEKGSTNIPPGSTLIFELELLKVIK